MVRFIIGIVRANAIYEKSIYIPIWLDLLYSKNNTRQAHICNLHSNMVRFIISAVAGVLSSL